MTIQAAAAPAEVKSGEVESGHAVELALLVLLATLWGGSYTFIKIGVETIPPLTLIAGRTLIAGVIPSTAGASSCSRPA